jgi:cytochrome c oxidase cbb3-type subunit 4
MRPGQTSDEPENLPVSYDTVAQVSQLVSLLLFIALFIGVVAYAFWPSNRKRFDAAQRKALGLDRDKPDNGSKS